MKYKRLHVQIWPDYGHIMDTEINALDEKGEEFTVEEYKAFSSVKLTQDKFESYSLKELAGKIFRADLFTFRGSIFKSNLQVVKVLDEE